MVDEHPIVREGLTGIYCSDPDIRVVGEARSAEEALRVLGRCDPHVVSLDVRLPGMNGLDLCYRLGRAQSRLRILALGSYGDVDTMAEAFRVGAHGFVRKGSCPSVLREAVRALARGEVYIDPAVNDLDIGHS